MDNHFHLLLVPKNEQGLGRCLHGTTFRYAQYYNQKYKRSGRLWQNRYFSCVVDKDHYLWVVARYIERNPVRARITERAEDWEWSSAKVHIKGERIDFLSIHGWLDEMEKKEYQRFVKDGGGEEDVRKATSTGRPLGDTRFIEGLEEKLGRPLKPKKGGRPKKAI